MTKNQFSERIKQLREERGLTQSELAEKSGLTVRSIQRLEKGENQPRGDSIKRLSEVFDVPVESLLVKELAENLFYLILLSLSPLVFLIHPELGVVPPFFLWLYKRNSIKDVDQLGRQVLNFQLSWVLIYFYVTLLLSFVVQVIFFNGVHSEYNLTELLLRRVFFFSLYALNIAVIFITAYFIYRDGKSRIPKGFAFKRNKIRPIILALYIFLVGILISGIVFPRKNYIEMEKAAVVRFTKKIIQIDYQEDGSHTDSLKQYLNPMIDSSRTNAILNGMFVSWGVIESNFIEIKDHGFSRNGSLQSHFLHIIYTDISTRRLFRYLLQIDKVDGRYYISDYYSEDMADTFFEKVELKKKNGILFWKVSGPMGIKVFKNHQLKSFGYMNYRKWKKEKEEIGYIYRMEDGKLKKQRIKGARD